MAIDRIYAESETGCCPRFEPAPWDEKVVTFKNRLFLRDRVLSVFHIPLNFGSVMKRNMEKIVGAGALADAPLMLCDNDSLFGTDIYIAVSKEVPGAKMERMSGIFLSKVFEGGYEKFGKWMKEMGEFVQSRGKKLEKMFVFYTTCPACAKAYGRNYVVLLARV
ncbi:MAG: hydrolase [Candidatus Micrarchaeia archaeon]